MKKLTLTLLGSTALSLLAAASVAGAPPRFHVQALHGGRPFYKTEHFHRCGQDVTCYTVTLGVSTSVPASDFRKKINLVNTFYKFCSTGSCLTEPKHNRLKVPRKSKYGKVRAAQMTTYTSHGEERFVYYGDAYKLTDRAGFGQTDTFVSSLKGEWEHGIKYKVTLNLDVSVAIGTE
jgi:hypothetical protein